MWTTVTGTKMAGKPAQIRSTTERATADRATLKIESSDDGGAHWSPIASGTEKKVGD
ncbi:MAG TPA: hypothetical protein VKE93_19445 [Candidatus Angelobacter sp.]|nr:hypothetical protein [Candidatus Angelobacter sp.]